MELKQEEGFFTLSQEAYITNLVRLHGLDVDVSAGLPCPKERIQEDDVVAEEENYSSSGPEGHWRMPLVGLPYTPRHPLRYELHGRNDYQTTCQGVPDRS